ncbi:hypothetical protein [Trueperella pyogenes]|uniref:hypothetical protein n=1 Tax=Trueperella pyogenes TaxID=1661 RepID=UPI00345E0325
MRRSVFGAAKLKPAGAFDGGIKLVLSQRHDARASTTAWASDSKDLHAGSLCSLT